MRAVLWGLSHKRASGDPGSVAYRLLLTKMRLDTAFRLSFYVTLALACACLAQAEAFFLVWFQFLCLPVAILVFTLAWRYEGKWVIHETASNYLGIFIGL